MKKSTEAAKAKQQPQPRAKLKDPNSVTVLVREGDDPTAAIAASFLRPTVQASRTIRDYTKDKDGGGPDVDALINELRAQIEAVGNGDMRRPEAMLVAQAHALDAIFAKLARRAAMNFGEYLNAAETYTRLALKAQAQCARTLEVLGNLKNPGAVAFVRQANIGNAVQVNNGGQPRAQDKIPNRSNELLGAGSGERLELDTPSTASGASSQLATVDPINRAKDSCR